jgi:hypothetical protein
MPVDLVVRKLGSGKYSDVFAVEIQHATRGKVAMKVMFYRDSTLCRAARAALQGDVQAAVRIKRHDAVSVSREFSRLSQDWLHAVSPHFVIVYVCEDVDGVADRFGHVLGHRLKTLTPLQRKHTNVSFMEMFDANMTTALARGLASEAAVRQLLFQVLYTLAALQRILPGFRHNDLSTNNVLVRHTRPWTARYSYRGTVFVLAGVPMFAAMADYDFIHVPGHSLLCNERITGGRYPGIGPSVNPSYDAHVFLKSVSRAIAPSAGRYPHLERFLKSLELMPVARPTDDDVMPRLVPATLLAHTYFEGLRERHASPQAAEAFFSV